MTEKKVRERTTKKSWLGMDEGYRTTLSNPKTGEILGTGDDMDKGKSIDKAYRDERERRGR